MKESTSIISRITIIGDFDPKSITKQTGITPTVTFRKGDLLSKTKLKRKFDGWELSQPKMITIDMEESIIPLLEIVYPAASILRQIARSNNLEVELAIATYIYESRAPIMHFSSSTMQMITAIGAEIDIDIYCMSVNGDEEWNSVLPPSGYQGMQ